MTATVTIHRIDGYICNLFLAESPEGLLLLDSGSVNDVERVEAYVTQRLGRSMSEVRLAIVTHMHPDHAGGAEVLRRRHGIPIAAHRDADLWYRGVTGFVQHRIDCYMAQFVARQLKRSEQAILYPRTVRPDYPLGDGDPLPFFGGWRALCVPGHTLHDLALYHEGSRTLYAGDALINLGGRIVLPTPVIFAGKMSESLSRLQALGASRVLFAHGDELPGDVTELFTSAMAQLDRLPSEIQRRYLRIAFFTPELWRAFLRKRWRRFRSPPT